MRIDHNDAGNKMVVRVNGRVDTVNAAEFERTCMEQVQGADRGVVLELSGLEYISSAGLRAVLAMAKRLKAQNRSLTLCCMSGMVKEVFDIAGFDRMLPITETLDEALGAGD